MILNTYLTFDGQCEQAFEFYRSVFGGEFQSFNRFNEMPPSEDFAVAPENQEKVMHVSLPIGDHSTLMGSDTAGGCGDNNQLVVGNNFSISVNLTDQQETKRVFTALAAGGTVTMQLDKTFWNSLFGMLTDQYGIQWMLNCDLNESS